MKRLHPPLLALLAVLLGLSGGVYAQGRAGGETEEERLFTEAEELFDKGRYEDAAQKYDRARALNPGRVATYVKRATIFLRDHRFPQAIELLAKAQRLAPEDLEVKQVLGLCLLRDTRKSARDRGLGYLEEVAMQLPGAFEAQLQVGEYYARRDPPRASTALELYLRYRPDERRGSDAAAQLHLGQAYLLQGRNNEAVTVLQAAFKERPQDLRTRLALGAALMERGECPRALPLYEAVVEDSEERPRIAYNLAVCYLLLGRTAEAERAADRYATRRPEDPRGALLQGDVALASNDGRTALRRYEDAGQLAASAGADAGAKLGLPARLARAQLQLGKPARAVALAETRLAEIAGGETPGPHEEGELLGVLLQGQLRGAPAHGPPVAEVANRLAQISGRDAAALALAGSGALLAGNLERARKLYSDANERDPALPRARMGLAQTMNRLALAGDATGARLPEAIALLEQALPLDDGPLTARNLATLYLIQGRADQAERVLAKPLGLLNDHRGAEALATDPMLWRLHGRALILLGKEAPGRQALERAAAEGQKRLTAASGDARGELQTLLTELKVELGGRYLSAGRYEDAAELLEAALRESTTPELRRQAARNASLTYLQWGRKRLAEVEEELAAGPAPGAVKQGEEALGLLQRALDRHGLEPGRKETGAALCSAALAAALATRYGVGRELAQRALTQEGGCDLNPPYDRLGADLIVAFLSYRDSGSATQREAALKVFNRLLTRSGSIAARGAGTLPSAANGGVSALLRALIRSDSEFLAYDYFTQGKTGRALQLLRAAQKLAGSESESPMLVHNLAVADLEEGHGSERTLEKLALRVPEALINLALLAERRGDARRALEYLRRAQEKGVKSPKLREWIDTKERILGGGEGS